MIEGDRMSKTGCQLCPRKCRADRKMGERGFCGESSKIRLARAALHYWEEPCISGKSGSGAVFFTGCSLRCVFCQNTHIARGEIGKEVSQERLSEIFLELQDKGANNINLVTAGHFLPAVIPALKKAKDEGLTIPIVYNTSAYESVESIRALDGLVDIYLPDFKYVSSDLSIRYSHASDYFETAAASIEEMVRQTKTPEFYRKYSRDGESRVWDTRCDEGKRETLNADQYNEVCYQQDMEGTEGDESEILMRRGTIVRHLLLPGCTEDSKRVIKYLLDTYSETIYISIMNQFTPLEDLEAWPELNRRVTEEEYDSIVDYAIEQGIENAFVQDGDVAEESFIPAFDYEGV